MIQDYWPKIEAIDQCIRTEAEELTEHVLLAVHEPMHLTKRSIGSLEKEVATEDDVLKHLIETKRPVPIVGESGVGKSHLVRWLDCRLRHEAQAHNWVIRRIPKNASLRRVLEILLDGLDDEEFVKTLGDIRRVGETLRTEDVAEHLLLHMGHALKRLAEQAEQRKRDLQQTNTRPGPEEEKRLRLLMKHTASKKLPALLNDIHFREQLTGEGRSVRLIADRITCGTSQERLASFDFQLHPGDLNIAEVELGDLSLEARQYVMQTSLNTDEEVRNQVTSLLNEVLNDACHAVFNQFFGANCGDFQELFRNIRKHLLNKKKELVVLIEDMAAISAIEDVLIDSLLEEGIRDGVVTLCNVRSAIAVTEGYEGYQRRKNTLATRARFEWLLGKSDNQEEDTYQRIIDFCGRYINAARWGEGRLKSFYKPGEDSANYPPIWEAQDKETADQVRELGVANDPSIPLFPFSSNAIRVLAEYHSRPSGPLEFNARNILNEVVLSTLRQGRPSFEDGKFPGENVFSIRCPGSLEQMLRESVHDEASRAVSFCAVWGGGAATLSELRGKIHPDHARLFNLPRLADLLDGTVPPPKNPVPIHPPEPTPVPGSDDPAHDEALAIFSEVDVWFENEAIPQKDAKVIRIALERSIYDLCSKEVGWLSFKKLPSISRNKIPQIYVPYNANNPNNPILFLAKEQQLEAPKNSFRTRLKEFVVALIRRERLGSWDYDNGYGDYCRYVNFIEPWCRDAVRHIVSNERAQVSGHLRKHYERALIINPSIENRENLKKISYLCTATDVLADELPDTGFEQWDVQLRDVASEWDTLQGAWADSFAKNRHAIEGDLVLGLFRGLGTTHVPRPVQKTVKHVCQEVLEKYRGLLLFEGCAREEEFNEALDMLERLIAELGSSSQYQGMGERTAKKFTNRVSKIRKGEHWLVVKAYLSLVEECDIGKTIVSVNRLKNLLLTDVHEVCDWWAEFYAVNLTRMKLENEAQGAAKRRELEVRLEEEIQVIQEKLEYVGELVGGQSEDN